MDLCSEPQHASAIAAFFLHSTPAVSPFVPFVGVQIYLWNNGAVNHSRELQWLKANLVKGFFFFLLILLPYFSARSLNHSSPHRYTKHLWLHSRGGAGVGVSSSLYYASQAASRSCNEALYFSTIPFSRALGTHLACILSLMNF